MAIPEGEPPATTRLRWALLAVAGLALGGTVTELALLGHWDSQEMRIPWVVLAAGPPAIRAVLVHPTRRSLRAVRAYAAVAAAVAWWGAVEHLTANGQFAQELHPDWAPAQLVWAAVRGGVPALAPLTLALPPLLTAAATLGHPALRPTALSHDVQHAY